MSDAQATSIAAALATVRASIEAACVRAKRDPSSVKLVAVSKLHPASSIRAAYDAGQRDFGENYVQELVAKHAELASFEGVRWHVIGHLQRNKSRDVVSRAALVHTVDSARLGEALDRACLDADRATLPVLVQVNVGGESQKSGCEPSELASVLDALAKLPRIAVRGLMTVPPHTDDASESRAFFDALARLRDTHGGERSLPELSMGMTHDMQYAIEAGATIVRVGTAIFGDRPTR